jgi:arylsulfatase A-like enzyme
MENASSAGPFDQLAAGQRGFDRFYGFLDGETDQFTPELGRRQPPRRSAEPPRPRATTCPRT